jgi:hypothetical protein
MNSRKLQQYQQHVHDMRTMTREEIAEEGCGWTECVQCKRLLVPIVNSMAYDLCYECAPEIDDDDEV